MYISSDFLNFLNLFEAIKAKAFISLAYNDLILFIGTSSPSSFFKSCNETQLQLLHILSGRDKYTTGYCFLGSRSWLTFGTTNLKIKIDLGSWLWFPNKRSLTWFQHDELPKGSQLLKLLNLLISFWTFIIETNKWLCNLII